MASRDDELMFITKIDRDNIKNHIKTTTHLGRFDFKKAFEQMKKLRIEEIEHYRENMAKEILVDILIVFSDLTKPKHYTLDKQIGVAQHPIDGLTNEVWIRDYLVDQIGDMFQVIIEDVSSLIRGAPPMDHVKKLVIKRKE
jgi:hypothetical protein